MASTPSNRLRLTPSNSPFLGRPSRSPIRANRPSTELSRLSLKRVVGTTCVSPTGFDTVQSSFAYVAGGAVVVVDVNENDYSQRFYRARPTAVPIYSISPAPNAPSTPNSTPKANDSRNRVAPGGDAWSDSPSSKTWTKRERIKAATCLSLSRDGRFLAVGETGFAPRVLVFNLQDSSSDIPLVSISEHTFGVNAVAWSDDAKYLASLGSANDGFIYIWKIDPRTGAAKLFQQNRCTSAVRGMVWMGSSLITFGVRHIKAWKVEEQPQSTSPSKQRFPGDGSFSLPQHQKPLPGRNILLGTLIEATFTCAAVLGPDKAIICSETGDISVLEETGTRGKDDTSTRTRLVRVSNLGFPIQCVSVRDHTAYVSGRGDKFATLDVAKVVDGKADCVLSTTEVAEGILALGFTNDHLVTIDARKSIDIWNPDIMPTAGLKDETRIPIPGPGDAIMGVEVLPKPNDSDAAFYTWSGSGNVMLWGLDGQIKSSLDVAIEQRESVNELEPPNQLCVVAASQGGRLFATADRLGVLRVIDSSSKMCLLDTKAHSSVCEVVAIFESENSNRVLMASCGRDRTAQLFRAERYSTGVSTPVDFETATSPRVVKTLTGPFEHFQTLEFAAKVVQVLFPSEDKLITCSMDRTLQIHDIISKDGEPDLIAALPSRVITLKSSPSSMVMAADEKSIYVSLLDRSVCQYDMANGRLVNCFKCMDEGGAESVILDSLIYGPAATPGEPSFLLGLSNTDKSVRMYESHSGSFLDREWGHTESINGVALINEDGPDRTVVSVGSDGTIMIWALDLSDPVAVSMSRDPSPAKDVSVPTANRPTLRRVLSKAELAEFQRPSSAGGSIGRRSPPRSVSRRTSKYGLLSGLFKTPTAATATAQTSPVIAEDSPCPRRRDSSSGTSGGSNSPPPSSPKSARTVTRQPSLQSLSATPTSQSSAAPKKKHSANSLRSSHGTCAFGTINMATEQATRSLRTYRKKLAAGADEPVRPELLAELDTELRLTAAALGERTVRDGGKGPTSEGLLNGLLDQYSERLVSMLEEKLLQRASEPSRSRPVSFVGPVDDAGDSDSTTVVEGGEAGVVAA